MAVSKAPNRAEIVSYLKSLGIDANQVAETGFNEAGYYTFPPGQQAPERLYEDRTWHEWPSNEAFRTVMHLYMGGTLANLPDNTPAAEPEVTAVNGEAELTGEALVADINDKLKEPRAEGAATVEVKTAPPGRTPTRKAAPKETK